MKIQKLHLRKSELTDSGLEDIYLTKLPKVVALIGRNGSGKSRLIKTIHSYLENAKSFEFSENITLPPNLLEDRLRRAKKIREDLHLKLERDKYVFLQSLEPENDEISRLLAEATKNYTSKRNNPTYIAQEATWINQLEALDKGVNIHLKFYFKWIKQSEINALNESFPDNIRTFDDLLEKVTESESYDELTALYGSGLTFLLELPAKLALDKYETEGDEKKFKNRTAYRRYSKLKALFEEFIGKELTWERKGANMKSQGRKLHVEVEGVWKIDDREFDYTEFSDGEKTLFGYVLLFFLLELNPNIRLKESILFIDEPELHLHPSSEIDLIEGVRKIIGDKGQLWIATHSLNILSHLNQDEIFMVKNGKISHPSESTPENSLNELMGLEDRVQKLSEFVSSISDWAYVNFMTQCFFDPEVIDHAVDKDPQLEVFKRSIQDTGSSTLLDFGAGKGRLFERLKEDENFSNLQYSALEPYKELHSNLQMLGVKNIYEDYKKLPEKTFDQIVLCNVLHEIPILDMVSTLNKVIKSIKDNGYLVVIEDRFLHKGEKIGSTGFVLMEEAELKELFKLKEIPHLIESNISRYKERIMCAIIKREDLPERITKDTLLSALDSLKKNSIKRIKGLRSENSENQTLKGISKGRRSGLYSQLYINAVLSEEYISNN